MITQISIFAENRQGTMNALTGILKENGINIVSLLTNDSGEFGIIRMLVDDAPKAYEAFTKEGFLCKEEPVLAVYMVDRPGYLNDILSAIRQSNINIKYMYISFDRESAAPIVVMKVSEADVVEECLESKGYKVLR